MHEVSCTVDDDQAVLIFVKLAKGDFSEEVVNVVGVIAKKETDEPMFSHQRFFSRLHTGFELKAALLEGIFEHGTKT
jgi:hypothetical protein